MPVSLLNNLVCKLPLGLAIVSLLTLAGCTSQPRIFEEDRFSRQLVFTVPRQDRSDAMAMTMGFTRSGFITDQNLLRNRIKSILKFHRLKKRSQFTIENLDLEAVVAEIPKKASLEETINSVAKDKRIESVQSIRSYELLTYNDPYFALQTTVQGDLIEHIHGIATGKSVRVGIVDTGVDRLHPELKRNIVYSRNFVDHDQSSFDHDEHGTAIAGVIGSAANNDLGIVGVAPDVKLLVFKACEQNLGTRRTSCDSVSIIKALNDVLRVQPDILNLSLAGPSDRIIERLLRSAAKEGVILVAAVNEAQGSALSFPANMPEVIAVSTTLDLEEAANGVLLAPWYRHADNCTWCNLRVQVWQLYGFCVRCRYCSVDD